ncbi:MAG: hypothetical protein LBF25_02030 [Puniceicoccales bacterium]|jgi:hypothetical protein|nr:hypothetical protein [Puniceicoccales bacterium]
MLDTTPTFYSSKTINFKQGKKMTSTVKNQSTSLLIDGDSIAARVRNNPRRCVQKNGNNVQPNPKSDARSKSMNSRKPETPKQEVTFENQDQSIVAWQPEQDQPEEQGQKEPFFNAKNALIAGAVVLGTAGAALIIKAKKSGNEESSDGKESKSTDDLNSTPQENQSTKTKVTASKPVKSKEPKAEKSVDLNNLSNDEITARLDKREMKFTDLSEDRRKAFLRNAAKETLRGLIRERKIPFGQLTNTERSIIVLNKVL